tara:strand:+ start:336 stop:878 length:543 start_codon:yes stop_codon:yes gene_type:complete
MQYIIVQIKQTSIKHPNKVWDSHSHFSNTLEDRQLLRASKKINKEFKYHEKLSKTTIGHHVPFLSTDKKSVYRLFLTTQELYQHDVDNWFLPHQEKGLISFEEIAKLKIDPKTAYIFGNLVSMYKKDNKDTHELKNSFSKFISIYGIERISKAFRKYIFKEIVKDKKDPKKGKVKDDNNN